ncbi:MAG: HAD family hydrolase [Butyrivibrio sp.]|nr:HAD family hydrolase [Butyrivibrio sp.]
MILLFDCFGTILDYKSVDFDKGLKKLWDMSFKEKCSFEELKEYNLELFHHVEDLHAKEEEMAFVKEELPLYAKKFGTEPLYMSPSEEADFMQLCTELDNIKGLPEALSEFEKNEIPMYVLSNSIYSSDGLKELLDRYGIGKFFKRVWSSSDFGKVKPNKDFFELGIQGALKDNPGEKRESIIYVGDTYESDVVGAKRAGIASVWINRKNAEDSQGIATKIIADAEGLADVIFNFNK